jgi:hypothetical protein
VNDKQHALLCIFKKSKDNNFSARHILDGLLTEIYGLLGTTHRTINYTTNQNIKQYYIINVPKHDVVAQYLYLSRRKNNMWIKSMLDALTGDNCDTTHAAGWVSTYLGQYHRDEASTVASKLSLGPNHQMDAVTFQAISTYINASVSTQRSIKRHINAFFGKRMFENDKALKSRVDSRVEPYTCGKFELSQVTANPKAALKDAYSMESEKIPYWYRDPSRCVAKYIAGQVADDLKKDGQNVIAPYVTTQNGYKKQGTTVLIGADHGKRAWRSYVKIFSRDGQHLRAFQERSQH